MDIGDPLVGRRGRDVTDVEADALRCRVCGSSLDASPMVCYVRVFDGSSSS